MLVPTLPVIGTGVIPQDQCLWTEELPLKNYSWDVYNSFLFKYAENIASNIQFEYETCNMTHSQEGKNKQDKLESYMLECYTSQVFLASDISQEEIKFQKLRSTVQFVLVISLLNPLFHLVTT